MRMNSTASSSWTSLGSDLDQLLRSRFLPSRRASRVCMPGELPVRLARCIRKLAPQTEWRAYTDDARIFFAIARRPETQGHNEAVVTMDVYFLDRNAAVFSAGKWAHTPEHGWWLDAIVPPSYDPQNGWWLDAVMLNAEGSLGSRAPPCRIVR